MKKWIILIVSLLLLLLANKAEAAITFTKPPNAITDLAATLQAGGSLTANTTYYYVVVATTEPMLYSSNARPSGISNEVTATTTDVNKTIRLDWSAPATATHYIVFRSTSSDTYTGSKRFRRESDNNLHAATTTNIYFVNDGAAIPTLYSSACLSVIPSGTAMPDGIDPRTYGTGKLVFDGGTAETPLTLQDFYNDAVSNSWTDYCKWDGNTFTLLGHFLPANTETHFRQYYGAFYMLGYFLLTSSHANSVLQFGYKSTTTGAATRGTTFYFLGAALGEQEFRFGTNAKIYDTTVFSQGSTASPYYISGITGGHYCQIVGVSEFKNLKIEDFGTFFVRIEVPINKLETTSYYGTIPGVDSRLSENITSHSYHYMYYAHNTRMDKFTFLLNTYQIRMMLGYEAGMYTNHIDCSYPNSTDADKLPVIYWQNEDVNSYVDLYHSVKLKVTDEDGTALNGAVVSFTDVDGVATDFDGTEVNNWTTDSEGYLWREKLTATAITDDTFEDTSKSWTTNQWKGRNVLVVNGVGKAQQRKVKSNTANTLTFTEDWLTNPGVGDLAGIILEMKRMRMTHIEGSGNGYGDAYTTKTTKNPYSITITYSGKRAYSGAFDLEAPIDQTILLDPGDTVIYDSTLYDSTIY